MDAKKRWLGYGIISGIVLLITTCFVVCYYYDDKNVDVYLLFLACFAPFYGSISYRLTKHIALPNIIFALPLLLCALFSCDRSLCPTTIPFDINLIVRKE